LVIVQILDGITGAVLGVITALIIADVTQGTGRFNLAQGIFGALIGVGATLSPTLSGLIVHHFGYTARIRQPRGRGAGGSFGCCCIPVRDKGEADQSGVTSCCSAFWDSPEWTGRESKLALAASPLPSVYA
jgi:MFS family permease